jgi:quercetin dioxygenase-like cupin family protein
MKHHRQRIAVLAGVAAIAAVVATVLIVLPAGATPPAGQSITPLAPVAILDEINENAKTDDWKAKIETHGLSNIHVNEVTIQPGGTTGWHSHPGPSFVIVKSGTATFYQADDPTCTPREIPTGSSLFEPANTVHIVRNEGSTPLVNVVVQIVPLGAPRRIDQADPGNCNF